MDNHPLFTRAELEQAIIDGQFELHYQPIVNARDLSTLGLEALVRMKWDERLLAPAAFIPAIESYTLSLELGAKVKQMAFAQFSQWNAAGIVHGVYMSVNISEAQFRDRALPQRVMHELHKAGIHHAMVRLEISEHSKLDDTLSADLVASILEKNITVVLDDVPTVGTTLISLANMRRAGVNDVKLDKSYVSLIGDNDMELAITAIISALQNMHMRITAEGVETNKQRTFLLNHGVYSQQGYLFSHPLPANECEAYLIENKAGESQ